MNQENPMTDTTVPGASSEGERPDLNRNAVLGWIDHEYGAGAAQEVAGILDTTDTNARSDAVPATEEETE